MELDLTTVRPHLVFECVCGSTAYNLTLPTSDIDKRGIYFDPDLIPPRDVLFSDRDLSQDLVKDEKGDTQYYRLDKFMKLAANVNPSLVEMLFMPEKHILLNSETMSVLMDHRHMFVSARARESFSGYAMEQIKKAKGQNKWVNNPQPEKMPDKLDFCKFVDVNYWKGMCTDPCYLDRVFAENIKNNVFPFRPVPIKDYINLDMFHASKQEGMQDVYRLYSYCHDNPRGVFRGPNQQLVLESIPKEDEWERFFGLMIFNEQEWKKAVNNWKQYWAWRRDRNDARWATQESGEMDYDSKNMMHCLRILMSGINILERGEPIIEWTGNGQKVLMDVRLGKYKYEDIMKIVDEYESRLKEVDAVVPDDVDINAINEIYKKILKIHRRR